jgi:PadR family transcriptional regulator PadR
MALLKKQDCYGYEISESLSKQIDIADGTVYPILRKLKADGLLTTYLQEESGGPPRKYYSLTQLGRETYEKDRSEYLLFAGSVKKLLEEDDSND